MTSGSTHQMSNQNRNGRRPSPLFRLSLSSAAPTHFRARSSTASHKLAVMVMTPRWQPITLWFGSHRNPLNPFITAGPFGHSTMGVATGQTTIVTTNFKIPIDLPAGDYQLSVVANGIASAEVAVKVAEAGTASSSA